MRYKVKAYVTLKKGILDIQGTTIEKALNALGFNEVSGMHIGKYMEFSAEGKNKEIVEKRISQMAKKLLANPVIEDFNFTMHQLGDK